MPCFCPVAPHLLSHQLSMQQRGLKRRERPWACACVCALITAMRAFWSYEYLKARGLYNSDSWRARTEVHWTLQGLRTQDGSPTCTHSDPLLWPDQGAGSHELITVRLSAWKRGDVGRVINSTKWAIKGLRSGNRGGRLQRWTREGGFFAETETFVDTEKEGRKRHGANLQSIWASLAFSVLAVANQAYKGVFLILFVRMARKRLDKIFLDKRFCMRTEPPFPSRIGLCTALSTAQELRRTIGLLQPQSLLSPKIVNN